MLEHTFFMPLAQLNAPGPRSTTATAPAAIAGAPAAATNAAGTATAPVAAGTQVATTTAPALEMNVAGIAAPADLVATSTSTSEITLLWKPTAGETGYHIYRTADGKSYDLIKDVPKEATGFKDAGLAANTQYGYKVVPFNAAGNGAAAETKGSTSASFFSSYGQIIIIVVMFAALYLFLFRGQRKTEKKRKEMIQELKKGDKVMTIGGMIARVVSIDGDEVVLKVDESANVKETYRKSAIQEVIDRDDKK